MRTIGQFVFGILLAVAASAQQAAAPPVTVTRPAAAAASATVVAGQHHPARSLLAGALATLMTTGQCEQIITAGEVSWCLSQCGTNVVTYFGGDGMTTTPPPPPVACLPVCYVMGSSTQCVSWATP